MAWTIIIILLVAFFAWAFAWVVGFIPFIWWVIFHFFDFLLDLIEFNLYPLWLLPRILVWWSMIFIVVMFFIRLFTKNH